MVLPKSFQITFTRNPLPGSSEPVGCPLTAPHSPFIQLDLHVETYVPVVHPALVQRPLRHHAADLKRQHMIETSVRLVP